MPGGATHQNLIRPAVLTGLFFVCKKNKHREDKYKRLISLFISKNTATKTRWHKKKEIWSLNLCQIDKSIVLLYTLAVSDSNPIYTGR